jgi:pSer/pThr/pTyr-binding forkhead associated (FHA) protein
MTTGSYEEPDWAVQPLAESSWMLTEIKSGVETAKHELYTRSTTIIGRAVDMVHIPLHHESISRQHARISFDSMGQPWLRDLQSSHGSFVNKKKLPRESIGKIESNSLHKGTRGIKLFVGDILTFGASTRYFSLAGEDFTNQQVKLKLPIQQNDTSSPEKSLQNSNNTSKKKEEDEGVSWGMSMTDDDDADSDNDNYVNNNGEKTISMDQQVSEKHRAQLDKLNVMKNKLINLETEDARIRRKGELTEGQEKQLQRNAEREIALKNSIREREENLYDKINGNKERKKSKAERKAMMEYKNSLEEDDDDYFDRTKVGSSTNRKNDTNHHSNEAESEVTLTQKWNKIVEEQKHLKDVALHKANNRVNDLHDRLKQAQASGDEEEFFLNNDLQLAREAKKKIDSSLVVGHTTIDEIEKLLKVVNPKIYCDRNSGYIGEEGRPTSSSSSSSGSAQDVNNKLSGTMAPPPPPSFPKQTTMAPPPPPSLPKQTTNTTEVCKIKQSKSESMQNDHDDTSTPTNNSTGDFIMPPPGKRKRLLGPTMPPPQPTPSSAVAPKSSSQKQAGTLSFLNQISAVNTSKDNTNSTTKGSKHSNKPNPSQPRTGMDTKKDEWVAPKGQDGSGRTKLNEKFAGRY